MDPTPSTIAASAMPTPTTQILPALRIARELGVGWPTLTIAEVAWVGILPILNVLWIVGVLGAEPLMSMIATNVSVDKPDGHPVAPIVMAIQGEPLLRIIVACVPGVLAANSLVNRIALAHGVVTHLLTNAQPVLAA